MKTKHYAMLWDNFTNEAIYIEDREPISPPEKYLILLTSSDNATDHIDHYKQNNSRLDFQLNLKDPHMYDEMQAVLADNGFTEDDLYAQTVPFSGFQRTAELFALDLNKCEYNPID